MYSLHLTRCTCSLDYHRESGEPLGLSICSFVSAERCIPASAGSFSGNYWMRFDHRRTRSFIRHMTSAEEHGDLSVRHSGDLEFRAEIVDRSATMEMTPDFPDLCAVPVPGPALSHHIRTQPVCPAIPCRAVPVWSCPFSVVPSVMAVPGTSCR